MQIYALRIVGLRGRQRGNEYWQLGTWLISTTARDKYATNDSQSPIGATFHGTAIGAKVVKIAFEARFENLIELEVVEFSGIVRFLAGT